VSKRSEFKGFVRFNLTKSELEEVKAVSGDPADAGALIGSLIEDGYKIEFKKDFWGEGVQCTAYAVDPGHRNAGMGLSGRGSDAFRAVRQLFWLNRHYFEGNWPDPTAHREIPYED